MTGSIAPSASSPFGEARGPLEDAPAEVRPRSLAGTDEVDLLDLVLPDVADRQVPRRAVEREAPRVAQAVGVDLAARALAADERVVVGDRVRVGAALTRVDAQDLPEQRVQGLPVAPLAVLVAAAAAVAHADVELLVGPEGDHPAVVVGLGVVLGDQEALGVPVGGVVVRARELGERVRPGFVRVVDVEQAARRVVGREREAEQALLAARADLVADVQERLVAARRCRIVPPFSTTKTRSSSGGDVTNTGESNVPISSSTTPDGSVVACGARWASSPPQAANASRASSTRRFID